MAAINFAATFIMEKIESALVSWKRQHPRDLPWKETKDPYKIWVSEIILQQTRVEQGTPYYLKFIDAFPSIQDLANATTDEVLACWKGLGYYSRARNMHETAKYLVKEKAGKFPKGYAEIIKLKGIGPYTAAAILSFAFNQKYPVLDGNVIRLVSRLFRIEGKRNSTTFVNQCYQFLNKLMELNQDPALFNQAIMDFGSKVCTPKNPNCEDCVLNEFCGAYLNNQVYLFPPAKKKIKKRKRCFHYFVAKRKKELLLSRRNQKDIWHKLYTFPELESQTGKAFTEKMIKSGLKNSMIQHRLSYLGR